MAITKVTSALLNSTALTSKAFGTSSIMIGDDVTGTIDAANYNVGLGVDVFEDLTSGDNNTTVGAFSLKNTATGSHNSAFGYAALFTNISGSENVAIGGGDGSTYNGALGLNTSGTKNVAVGNGALQANQTASYNTAVGYVAGLSITTGTQNVAVGALALDAAQTASNNTALGYATLTINTASNNTAVGHKALQLNTTGQDNVVLGLSAGSSISTGGNNTVIGSAAGVTGVALTTGGQNVLIGRHCHTSTASTVYANGIGYNIEALGGYTTVGESGSDIRAQHGVATWTTISDERVKKDIQDSTVGLNFINDLRPVTFNYKNKGDLPTDFRGYEEGSTQVFKSEKGQHGFIAQEVKAAIDKHSDIKDGFSMWDADDEIGQQRVGETALIPVLVKAIQELSAEVETLKSQLGE
jgi:hypothetical protein